MFNGNMSTVSFINRYTTDNLHALKWLKLIFSASCTFDYLTALSPLHNLDGFLAPELNHFPVKLTFAGLKRQRNASPNSKVGILVAYLRLVFANLHLIPQNRRVTFRAASSVTFHSPPRISNLFFSRNNSQFIESKNIRLSAANMYITVPALKTNRFLGKNVIIPIL